MPSNTSEPSLQTNSSPDPKMRDTNPVVTPAEQPRVGNDTQEMGRHPNLKPVDC